MSRSVCLGLAAACLFSLQPLSARADTPVRIVSFNAEILSAPRIRAGQIQKFRFDYARNRHLERVAAVIETLSPDILNLVEVTSKPAVDRLIEILHEKGMTDYQGYHVENNDSYTGMDVALITRLKPDLIEGEAIRTINSKADDPTWRQAYTYEGWNGKPRRGNTSISRNAVYYFTINGQKLGFFGLHLKSNPSDPAANAKRTAEAAVAVRAIRAEIAGRGYLPFVLGDLNDYDPDIEDRDETRDTATKVLASIKDYDPEQSGPELINAAKHIVRQADRYTSHWDWNENGAHDPQDVYTMIDHILLPKQLDPLVKRVFISRCVALNTSDHYPVVVDLVFPATASPVASK